MVLILSVLPLASTVIFRAPGRTIGGAVGIRFGDSIFFAVIAGGIFFNLGIGLIGFLIGSKGGGNRAKNAVDANKMDFMVSNISFSKRLG